MTRSTTPTQQAVEAVWRIEAPRLIGGLMRITRDLGLAEELAQDALVAALEQWPESGVPASPGAWLTAVAQRRRIDLVRRSERGRQKYAQLAQDLPTEVNPVVALDPDLIEDDILRLMFVSCHPVLSTEARVALTLRLLGGLSTPEIARAFLIPESTVAQRIVRAKKTLGTAAVAFEVPEEADRRDRITSVLEVIYLVYNEGYAATAGDDWVRPELCRDAMRLARILATLAPEEPEVHGLLALMEIQSSREHARVGADGAAVLMRDQDRSRWDALLIRRGLTSLERAERLGGSDIGSYTVQASLAACHARARRFEDTDWHRIAALYEVLAGIAPSPVVELNRAVAVSQADGPQAGLAVLDAIVDTPAMAGYHLLPSVRGDLLERLGRCTEARTEFLRAVELAGNGAERALLTARAVALEDG